jgi:hypothetical protein
MDHCDVVGERKSEQSLIGWFVVEEVKSPFEIPFP